MNKKLKIDVVNKTEMELPAYETSGSAGMDLRCNEDNVIIRPSERVLVGTGLYIQIPSGYEAQIRPRSGLALKSGVSILNSPGTIDSDYTGEIKVILINHGNETVEFHKGDRIAQMVVSKYESVEWNSVESLVSTERGNGGFGHSGMN